MKRLLPRDARPKRTAVASGTLQSQAIDLPIYKKLTFLRRDSIILTACIFTGVLFLLLVSVFALTASTLPPELPLFYSLPWGEGQLIALPFFMLLPILLLAVFILNSFIGAILYTNYKTLVQLLFFGTALSAFLLATTVVKIVLLVKG